MVVRDNHIRSNSVNVYYFIGSNGNMSSNGRITRSKGPADNVSLPPIMRPKKGTNTEAETKKNMATQHQADGQGDQLGNTVETDISIC